MPTLSEIQRQIQDHPTNVAAVRRQQVMFKPVKKTFRSLRVNKDKVAQWLVTIPPGRFVTTRGGVVIVNNGDDFADLVVYTSREQQKQFEQTGRRFPEGISLNYKKPNKFNDSGENPESPIG